MADKKEYVVPKMEDLRTTFKRYDNAFLELELGVSMQCVRNFKSGKTKNLSTENYQKAKALFLDNAQSDIRKLR